MKRISFHLFVSSFFSSMSYSFQRTDLSPPWFNLFLSTFTFWCLAAGVFPACDWIKGPYQDLQLDQVQRACLRDTERCVYHPVPWHTQLVAKKDQNWVTGHFKVWGSQHCYLWHRRVWLLVVLVDRWCWWGDQDQIWFSQVHRETTAVSEYLPRN